MRRSQSTGDIDGRGSDDGAAEYIQYIDEGVNFILRITIFIFVIKFFTIISLISPWQSFNQTTATRKKTKRRQRRKLQLFSCHLRRWTWTAALRCVHDFFMIFYDF